MRRTVEQQLRDALYVLVLAPETRAWLEANDPQALKQARRALGASEVQDLFREFGADYDAVPGGAR